MAHPLLRGFGRKPVVENGTKNGVAAPPVSQTPPPADLPVGSAPPLTLAALDLARELLRGVEHFVLSTPDLDTPGFLDRLRRTAARLTGNAEVDELEVHRQWAADSLSAFGQLQRRYLSEREDELWRLLSVYQDHQKVEGASNNQFHEAIKGVHERMGNVVRLNDLRQVRERLESELQRAATLVEQKTKTDEERALQLTAQVHQLEAALVHARHEALRDALTGVYHRGGFEVQIEAALLSPTPCALAMIDVDNFKGINDSLGHLVGDQILRLAVEILGKIARPGEVIGRFGGDEFCMLAPSMSADRLADRFNQVAAQRPINFQYEERLCSVRLSFSIGVAGSIPGDTPASLIERADGALYEVKRNGKGHARAAAMVPSMAR